MYPAQTKYHRASSVSEAVQMLTDNEGAKVLAGGHSLIPMMKLRLAEPAALVDIGHIEALKGIAANNTGLSIGGDDDVHRDCVVRLGEEARAAAGGGGWIGGRPGCAKPGHHRGERIPR